MRGKFTPTTSDPLAFDWSVESQGKNPANAGEWLMVVNIQAHGGDGQYRYYHDGLPVNGPRIEVIYRVCHDKPGSFWVADGSGQIVKLPYYLSAPYCPPATPGP